MDLTKEQIEKYKIFLKENQKDIERFYPALSSQQKKFTDLVMDIILNPTLTKWELADRNSCGVATVCRAVGIIKGCYLPYRYSNRMRARLGVCLLGEGRLTALGKVTEDALRIQLGKGINFGKPFPRLIPKRG